jgi:hypothetical protein
MANLLTLEEFERLLENFDFEAYSAAKKLRRERPLGTRHHQGALAGPIRRWNEN